MNQQKKYRELNITNFYSILIIYAAVILFSGVYLFLWQGFGSQGLAFAIEGKDQVFNAFDIVLFGATIAAIFLVIISLLAFKKKKDTKLFIISVAFFLFALQEIMQIFENFFPHEYIFISNADRVLDLLILLSFVLLIYRK